MIAGNFEDKYNTKNPISRILVNNFLSTFKNLLDEIDESKKIVEVGVGEGYLTKIISDKFPDSQIWASDISKDIIKVANDNLKGRKVHLDIEDTQNLSYANDMFDLCVCCEVLEHVQNPKKALSEIRRITRNKVILSVPSESLWRLLNMLRLKYLLSFGNTPGHVNHWTPAQFIRLVEGSGFKVISRKLPLPWQMLLIKKL